MKIYKWLIAAIVASLCLMGCGATFPDPPQSSAGIMFTGSNQAVLTSEQNLRLDTVDYICNYYEPYLPGPFPDRTTRTFVLHGDDIVLTKWSSIIHYRVTTGEIVGVTNNAATTQFKLKVAHVGDSESAYDGKIIITRIREDAVTITWPADDTRAY